MDPGLIFGIVLVVLTLVGVTVALIVTWSRGRIAWKTGPYGVQWTGPEGFDVNRLAVAMDRALDTLSAVWPREKVLLALAASKVIVNPEPAWVDIWGRKVGGLTVGDIVFVGSDLAALAHELAHRCEYVLEGKVDEDHALWLSRGIFAALDKYTL